MILHRDSAQTDAKPLNFPFNKKRSQCHTHTGAHTDGAPGAPLHTAAAQADETRLLTWQLTHDGGCVVRHTISNSIVCH